MSSKTQIPPTELETVLVVEDEILVRTAIAEYLRHCGYRVVEAASADEAMTVLQETAKAHVSPECQSQTNALRNV
jgi:CheY-like chemotaxis protein